MTSTRLTTLLQVLAKSLAPALVVGAALVRLVAPYALLRSIHVGRDLPFPFWMGLLLSGALAAALGMTLLLTRSMTPTERWLRRHAWQSALGYLLLLFPLMSRPQDEDPNIIVVARLATLIAVGTIVGNLAGLAWYHRIAADELPPA